MAGTHTLRRLLGAGLLGAGLSLVAGPLGAQIAHGQVNTCRSDPLITLSNGRVVDLAASIRDHVADIKSVRYVVVGPVGTHVVSIEKTRSDVSSREHVQYIAANRPGTYDAYITVTTGHDAKVVAQFYFASSTRHVLSNSTFIGWSNDDQQVHFIDRSTGAIVAQSQDGVSTGQRPGAVQTSPVLSQWTSLLDAPLS